MTGSWSRSALVGTLLALLLPVVAGCVALPSAGPVVTAAVGADEDDGPATSYVPPPPVPGATPSEVVRGFLDAMTATPLNLGVARQFLSRAGQAAWQPERATVLYDAVGEPRGLTDVVVALEGASTLDERGGWQGATDLDRLTFPVTTEDGEWRIERAPDALVVPETWFGQRFRRLNLYFFDPSGTLLVPEPVFVPLGEQRPTALVEGLLAGPATDLPGVVRSFLPTGAELEQLSVVVDGDGVAEVALRGGPLEGDAAVRGLAQLTWTLRQEPSVQALRVTVDGEPVTLPGGPPEVLVEGAAGVDPTVAGADDGLFGLRDQRVVAADGGDGLGPLGSGDYDLRDLAVDLRAERVAGVAADGSAVFVAPLLDDLGAGRGVSTFAGEDLARPGWDHAGRLWLLDRGERSAAVSLVQRGRRREVEVPGVTGAPARQLVVSRDGTRLVVVLGTAAGDVVRVHRVRTDARGRVRGVGAGRTLAARTGDPLRVVDLAWRSATTLVVATRLSAQLTELRTVPVDGSPAGLDGSPASELVRGRVQGVAAAPVPAAPLWLTTPDGVVDRLGAEPSSVVVVPGTTALTYVG